MRRVVTFFHWLGTLYLELFRGFFSLLFSAALVGALAFIIAWPLWFLSSHSPQLYSIGIVLIGLAALILFIIQKGKKMEKEELVRIAKKGGLLFLFLLLLLLCIIFLSTSRLIAGILTVFPLSICGALIFSQSR